MIKYKIIIGKVKKRFKEFLKEIENQNYDITKVKFSAIGVNCFGNVYKNIQVINKEDN